MKNIVTIGMSLMFAVASAFATPTTDVDLSTISKAETQALFGESNVDVKTLNKNEMATTEGKGSMIIPNSQLRPYRWVIVISSVGPGGWQWRRI